MNDSNGQSDREFRGNGEQPRRPDEVAYAQFAGVLRDAAGVVEHTRGLFTQTLRAVTHPRDAVAGFTNLLNSLANPTPTVREITTGNGSSSVEVTGIETYAVADVTVAGAPGAAGAENWPTPPAPTGLEVQQPKTDGSLGGLILGTMGRVATRPVGMLTETLRQVQQVQYGVAPSQALDNVVSSFLGTTSRDETAELKKRGAALVRVSCQPEYLRRDVHPSFSNILDELLPDEARILRFLAVAGTQPAIDVRTKKLFQVGSVKLVGGVNMIPEMSGCKWPDRGYHYLANLSRHSLIDFSKEPVDDYRRYALLEVQPAATAAIARAPKSISVYRSISLTSFGRQFVSACIDIDGYDGGGWATDGRADKIIGKGPPA
jgi:Abortive infection alpha